MDQSNRPLTLVTGCARSGTSLTTQVLQACGANLGRVNSLYENTGVRDRLVKPLLSKLGADPLGQNPLPPAELVDGPEDWAEQVLARLDGADTYKEAKIALIWPIWVQAFPGARWIVCYRDPDDIAASCKRTSFMKAYTNRADWAWWAQQYHDRLLELRHSVGDQAITVRPGDAIHDPDQFRPAVEHAGLTWDRAAVERVISPGAWHD